MTTVQTIAVGILGFVFGFICAVALLWVAKHYADIDEENPNNYDNL